MDRKVTIENQAENLRVLLADRLGARRGTLARRVAKAGRLLPTGIRNDISAVAEAEIMTQHPKLGRRIDANFTQPAYARAVAHLKAIDVKDRRKGVILSILGSMAFNLLVVIVLLIVVLRWRGFV